MTAKELLKEAEELKEKMRAHRRFLHTHPGCGFEIAETIDYVREELIKMGYEPAGAAALSLAAHRWLEENGR